MRLGALDMVPVIVDRLDWIESLRVCGFGFIEYIYPGVCSMTCRNSETLTEDGFYLHPQSCAAKEQGRRGGLSKGYLYVSRYSTCTKTLYLFG